MFFEINDNTRLSDIQKTFSDFYPYLRIRFYRKPHRKYQTVLLRSRIAASKTVGEIKRTHVSGLLEIQPWYKVAQVEREFLERFGLFVQVFWLYQHTWELASQMDDLSLKMLNEMGRNAEDNFLIADFEEMYLAMM